MQTLELTSRSTTAFTNTKCCFCVRTGTVSPRKPNGDVLVFVVRLSVCRFFRGRLPLCPNDLCSNACDAVFWWWYFVFSGFDVTVLLSVCFASLKRSCSLLLDWTSYCRCVMRIVFRRETTHGTYKLYVYVDSMYSLCVYGVFVSLCVPITVLWAGGVVPDSPKPRQHDNVDDGHQRADLQPVAQGLHSPGGQLLGWRVRTTV